MSPNKATSAAKKTKTKTKRKDKNTSEYAQENTKQKYSYTAANAKVRLFRDRHIRLENERLQKRLDKLRPNAAGDRPFDTQLQKVRDKARQQARARKERERKLRSSGRAEVPKEQIPVGEESAHRYLQHVDLARACEREAREVAAMREEMDRLKTQVRVAEQQRRNESRAIISLARFAEANPMKRMAQPDPAAIVIPSKDVRGLETTALGAGVKRACDRLHERRSLALAAAGSAEARREAAEAALLDVSEKLRVARERRDDPEADKALAAAHRTAIRLRTDVETLRLERQLGYSFAAACEGDLAVLGEEAEILKGKEARKRGKITRISWERDAARSEYQAWVRGGLAGDVARAVEVLAGAARIVEKMERLRIRAQEEEQLDRVRSRASRPTQAD